MIEQGIPGDESKAAEEMARSGAFRIRPEFSVLKGVAFLAALALIFSGNGVDAQVCGVASPISTTSNVYPGNTNNVFSFWIGRNRNVLYNGTIGGVSSADLTGNPADPP